MTFPSSDQLLTRACEGDQNAAQELLAMHRSQLKRMISVRMDPRLQARFDASDVVQDALIEASRRLTDYAQQPKIAFYPWLRQLTWERLVQLQRHHRDRKKRSVNREQHERLPLPDQSAVQLVDRLIANGTSPSGRITAQERLDQAREALDLLPEFYREVLILRHLEQLSVEETADVLGVSKGTVKSRHFRAISRLQQRLRVDSTSGEGNS